ncbi:MAG: DUF3810 domain-containing protein [Clostridiales bacterium]|jgi:hypothetical protein|nr:DUF3810 domain-containing protein [Clostridiales bacterium]
MMQPHAKTAHFITSERNRALLRRLPWLILIPLGLFMPLLAQNNPAFIEKYYSQGVYPVINAILRTIFGFIPVSIAELLLYALILFAPLLPLIRGVRVLWGYAHWSRFVHLCITYLIIFGVALNAFYIFWGFQYFRPKLGALLSLQVTERPIEELDALCHTLAQTALTLREEAAEDGAGVFMLTGGIDGAINKIPAAYIALGQEMPLFSVPPTAPKKVLNSEAMSWAGISGIYIPFTAEPNVNARQPHLLLASSAAHESAHGIGIAREDEANFVSYLACARSDDASIRYSGVMLALIHSGNQLYAADQELYGKLIETYSEGMIRDLNHHSAYWRAYEGPVEEGMNQMNDTYLKHNQQESGVKSYGEMVDLLLAWHAR